MEKTNNYRDLYKNYIIKNSQNFPRTFEASFANPLNTLLSQIYPNNKTLDSLIDQTTDLKKCLDSFRPLDFSHAKKLDEALDTHYTHDSNRIEGNTLTLKETDLVINKGITIGGRSMREHLEAINHKEAIDYIRELSQDQESINEYNIKSIHNIILKSIDSKNAGTYRNTEVIIGGSKHIPPPHYLVQDKMTEYFNFYKENKSLHPVILAADMHEKLATIHPFIDGNGRTSRLVMNLIMLQKGYPIVNISSDKTSRGNYYNSLEYANTNNDSSKFHEFISQETKKSLFNYLGVAITTEDKTKGDYFFNKVGPILEKKTSE